MRSLVVGIVLSLAAVGASASATCQKLEPNGPIVVFPIGCPLGWQEI